jgi:hypothetical protein
MEMDLLAVGGRPDALCDGSWDLCLGGCPGLDRGGNVKAWRYGKKTKSACLLFLSMLWTSGRSCRCHDVVCCGVEEEWRTKSKLSESEQSLQGCHRNAAGRSHPPAPRLSRRVSGHTTETTTTPLAHVANFK